MSDVAPVPVESQDVEVQTDRVEVFRNPERDVLWIVPRFADGAMYPKEWEAEEDFGKWLRIRHLISRACERYRITELTVLESHIVIMMYSWFFNEQQKVAFAESVVTLLRSELGRDIQITYRPD